MAEDTYLELIGKVLNLPEKINVLNLRGIATSLKGKYDLLILTDKNFKKNNGDNALLKKLKLLLGGNGKIVYIGQDNNSSDLFREICNKNSFREIIFRKIDNNLISVYMRKETDEESVKRYKKYFSDDQKNLYKNFFVRLIFNMGHKFISNAGRRNRGTFLDMGSGIGYHLNFEDLTAKKKYICLDFDSRMLKEIKHSGVVKILASCESIPLKAGSADVVIASHVLEHVSDLTRCLKEVRRILSKKGIFLVVLPCDPGFMWNLSAKFTPSRKRLKLEGLDYDLIMRNEHINPFQHCISELSKYFDVKKKIYYPLFLPSHNLNLICGIELEKKSK